jgi:hypothetical protein
LHFPRAGGFVWAGIFGTFVTTKVQAFSHKLFGLTQKVTKSSRSNRFAYAELAEIRGLTDTVGS